jgi:hypothetical protein
VSETDTADRFVLELAPGRDPLARRGLPERSVTHHLGQLLKRLKEGDEPRTTPTVTSEVPGVPEADDAQHDGEDDGERGPAPEDVAKHDPTPFGMAGRGDIPGPRGSPTRKR